MNYQTYTLPDNALPLARDRRPFTGLRTNTIDQFINRLASFPEQVGRLSDAVRPRPSLPSHYTVIESHIDCVAVDESSLNWLVVHGFEPDHFHRFVPEVYPDHFTCKLVLPTDDVARRRQLCRELQRLSNLAYHELQRHGISGYIELEVWQNQLHRFDIPFRVPDKMALEQFPLPPGYLREAQMETRVFKRSDIHVKTPLPVRGIGFEGANHEQMEQLRHRLHAAGFYEVVTEGGHKVYTAQFVHMSQAKRVYSQLGSYFQLAGGICDITLEPCIGFWRLQDNTGRASPIPPLVVCGEKE